MSEPETIYCTKCGTPNQATSSFCTKCGNRLIAPENNFTDAKTDSQGDTNSSTQYTSSRQAAPENHPLDIDSAILSFIGTKTEYYVPKFQELKIQGKKISWNWFAFLWGPFWLIYRKMYEYGVILLVAEFILYAIDFSILTWASSIALGILGNYLYLYRLEQLARQANAMPESSRNYFVAKYSGVNTTAAVVTVVIYAIIMFVVISAEVLSATAELLYWLL